MIGRENYRGRKGMKVGKIIKGDRERGRQTGRDKYMDMKKSKRDRKTETKT